MRANLVNEGGGSMRFVHILLMRSTTLVVVTMVMGMRLREWVEE